MLFDRYRSVFRARLLKDFKPIGATKAKRAQVCEKQVDTWTAELEVNHQLDERERRLGLSSLVNEHRERLEAELQKAVRASDASLDSVDPEHREGQAAKFIHGLVDRLIISTRPTRGSAPFFSDLWAAVKSFVAREFGFGSAEVLQPVEVDPSKDVKEDFLKELKCEIKQARAFAEKLSKRLAPEEMRALQDPLPAFTRHAEIRGKRKPGSDCRTTDRRELRTEYVPRGNGADIIKLTGMEETVESRDVRIAVLRGTVTNALHRRIVSFSQDYNRHVQHSKLKCCVDPVITCSVPFAADTCTKFVRLLTKAGDNPLHVLLFIVVLQRDLGIVPPEVRNNAQVVLVVLQDEDMFPGLQPTHIPSPAWLVDVMKLTGEWLLRKYGLPFYTRALQTVNDVHEATMLVRTSPCTMARMLVGLRKILLVEERSARTQQEKQLFDELTCPSELGRYFPHDQRGAVVDDASSWLRQQPEPRAWLDRLMALPNLPAYLTQYLDRRLASRITSCAPIPKRYVREVWLDLLRRAPSTTDRPQHRANYTVYELNARAISYRQRTIVFNNTATQAHVYCTSREQFLAPASHTTPWDEFKAEYGQAEDRLAQRLMRCDLCCLFTDEFGVHFPGKLANRCSVRVSRACCGCKRVCLSLRAVATVCMCWSLPDV